MAKILCGGVLLGTTTVFLILGIISEISIIILVVFSLFWYGLATAILKWGINDIKRLSHKQRG